MIPKDNTTENHEPRGREKVARAGFGSDSGRSGDRGGVTAEHHDNVAIFLAKRDHILSLIASNPELKKHVDVSALNVDPLKLSASELTGRLNGISSLDTLLAAAADDDEVSPEKPSGVRRFVVAVGRIFDKDWANKFGNGGAKLVNGLDVPLDELSYLQPLQHIELGVARHKNAQHSESQRFIG